VVSDDHAGLRQAIREVLAEAAWQRCYVHFLRNALDYLRKRYGDDRAGFELTTDAEVDPAAMRRGR
jgi:transposase-like protein